MIGNVVTQYIPSLKHWKEMFSKYPFYEVREQVAINEIKINRKLFDFNFLNPEILKLVLTAKYHPATLTSE